MIIGILQADPVYPELRERFGNYPAMFRVLLDRVGYEPPPEFVTFDVENGEYPASLEACDGYLITGSKAGANDDAAWIRRLEAFVVACHEERIPLVGICFGHQLIAKALGGKVETTASGWGVGVHSHRIVAQAPFMSPPCRALSLLVSHRDQVVELPDGAELLASSDFCPIAMYRVGNHIYAQQSHPEFVREYARGMLERRREILGEARYREGIDSLTRETNEELVARWILNFFSAAGGVRHE